MIESIKHRCARCGKRFKKGGISYRLKAELISHFDGHIDVSGKKGLDEVIDKINEDLAGLAQKQIENQVYQKFEYIVCPSCRDEIENFLAQEDRI
jgi:DNA-directed RNA polymerase subunit RPC12/RpoP